MLDFKSRCEENADLHLDMFRGSEVIGDMQFHGQVRPVYWLLCDQGRRKQTLSSFQVISFSERLKYLKYH